MGLGKITLNVHSAFRVITVILIILLLLTTIFFWFEYSTQSYLALREAKNARMAMEMLDKQYYAKDKCIYDASTIYGLSEESMEEIQSLTNENGIVYLKTFDMKKRKVLEFTYRNKRYEVNYLNDSGEEEYQVKRRKSSK